MFDGFFYPWCFAFKGWKMMLKRNWLGRVGGAPAICPARSRKLLLWEAAVRHLWVLRGPTYKHKNLSESLWEHRGRRQLWEITQWWLASPKIGICRPFFPMLSWHSSSLEVVILQSFRFYSVFWFSSYCASLFLSNFNVLPSECAESKPSALNDFTDPVILHTSTDTYLLGLLLSMLILLPPHICK